LNDLAKAMKALDGKNTLFLQHAIERVERPGGSHEGVGRKKSSSAFNVFVFGSENGQTTAVKI